MIIIKIIIIIIRGDILVSKAEWLIIKALPQLNSPSSISSFVLSHRAVVSEKWNKLLLDCCCYSVDRLKCFKAFYIKRQKSWRVAYRIIVSTRIKGSNETWSTKLQSVLVKLSQIELVKNSPQTLLPRSQSLWPVPETL